MRCGEWQRVISIPTAARQPRRDTWWKTSGRISSEDFLVVAYNIRLTEIIVALARQQIAFDPFSDVRNQSVWYGLTGLQPKPVRVKGPSRSLTVRSTFGVANASLARDFAIQVLGAAPAGDTLCDALPGSRKGIIIPRSGRRLLFHSLWTSPCTVANVCFDRRPWVGSDHMRKKGSGSGMST